ncbi:hypothetical protein A2335_03310 [Candidatus Peregrinibacteria bacterium RIFOXYB2_FULL_32_7]|nr:MAG: hypothetical protein A2335_03310 [Candidatus Peregrinibacteria bacterium RIFOXYB2_FULL_32_7]
MRETLNTLIEKYQESQEGQERAQIAEQIWIKLQGYIRRNIRNAIAYRGQDLDVEEADLESFIALTIFERILKGNFTRNPATAIKLRIKYAPIDALLGKTPYFSHFDSKRMKRFLDWDALSEDEQNAYLREANHTAYTIDPEIITKRIQEILGVRNQEILFDYFEEATNKELAEKYDISEKEMANLIARLKYKIANDPELLQIMEQLTGRTLIKIKDIIYLRIKISGYKEKRTAKNFLRNSLLRFLEIPR